MTDWAKVLQESVEGKPDEVPAGWHTTAQLRKSFDLSETALRRRLNRLMQSNRVETREFRIRVNERVVRVPHYRLVGESETAA